MTKAYRPKLIMRSFYIEQIKSDYKTKGIEKFIPEDILDKAVWIANKLNQIFAKHGLYPSNLHITDLGKSMDFLNGKWFDLMQLYPDGLLSRLTWQNMLIQKGWKNADKKKLEIAFQQFNNRYDKVKTLKL